MILSCVFQVDYELPSFEATPSKSFTMDTKGVEPGGHDNSDSSDWSSSSDDEGDREPGEGRGVALKPSHHTNLIAQWEWRTMTDGTDTRWVGYVGVVYISMGIPVCLLIAIPSL